MCYYYDFYRAGNERLISLKKSGKLGSKRHYVGLTDGLSERYTSKSGWIYDDGTESNSSVWEVGIIIFNAGVTALVSSIEVPLFSQFNEPNNKENGQDCAILSDVGAEDANCERKYGVVCQRASFIAPKNSHYKKVI